MNKMEKAKKKQEAINVVLESERGEILTGNLDELLQKI